MRHLYGHYNDRGSGMSPVNGNTARERARSILILVLLVSVITLGIVGGRAMGYRAEAHRLFVGTMQTECNDALTLTNSLSRTAGSNSSGILGRVRSHVHTMDVLNQLNVGLEGGDRYLVPTDIFTRLYSIIDSYTELLRTGMSTTELLTELMTELTRLSEMVNALSR